MATDICGDNRFEIIQKAKQLLIKSTNIKDSPEEMKVIDTILFRMWQMGWLPESQEKQKLWNWISIKDRLPENDDRVIVRLRSNEYSKVNDKMKIAFFYGGRFYIYIAHSDGITNDTITYPCLVNNISYWMPLPEPPEEENEN